VTTPLSRSWITFDLNDSEEITYLPKLEAHLSEESSALKSARSFVLIKKFFPVRLVAIIMSAFESPIA
jgi:hypothetical protein